MLNISLCDNENQHYQQKLHDIHKTCFNVRCFQRHKHGGAYAIFTPFSRIGHQFNARERR